MINLVGGLIAQVPEKVKAKKTKTKKFIVKPMVMNTFGSISTALRIYGVFLPNFTPIWSWK